MADAKLEIKVGVDVDPAKKSLRQVDDALNKTASNAKVAGSKIDEAFKSASGKVQESIGPLGKLLGPTALGLGAIGLAAGAMGAAIGKAFAAVQTGAEAAKRLGRESGLTSQQIQTLTSRALEAKRAMDSFDVAIGTIAGSITAKLSPAVEGIAALMTGAMSWQTALTGTGLNQIGVGAFNAGQNYKPYRNAVLDREAAQKAFKDRLKAQREQQDRAQAIADQAAAARYRTAFDAAAGMGAQPDWSTWVAIQEDRRQNEVTRAGWGVEYSDMIARYHAERRASNLERRTRIQAGFESEPTFMGQFGGTIGTGAGGALAALIGGGGASGVVTSIGGTVSGIASTAATAALGPIAGGLIGGVIDGFVGLISGAFGGEDAASKTRREAKEAARKQRLRDLASMRRNALPEFDPFLGMKARTTVVNVNFNGPVGSPGRIARQLSDAMGGA